VRISGRPEQTDNLAQMRALRTDLSPKFDARELRDEYFPAEARQ
jgi:hypothetical protein